jgi:hypothetical protein
MERTRCICDVVNGNQHAAAQVNRDKGNQRHCREPITLSRSERLGGGLVEHPPKVDTASSFDPADGNGFQVGPVAGVYLTPRNWRPAFAKLRPERRHYLKKQAVRI